MRLPIHVASTISRASYGHGFNDPFIKGLHLEKDKHWNDLEKKWEAKNQVQWYLTRVRILTLCLLSTLIFGNREKMYQRKNQSRTISTSYTKKDSSTATLR